MSMVRPARTTPAPVTVIGQGARTGSRPDVVATEEPLEIRVMAAGRRRLTSVTMRTPGHDFELAAGFLHGEGVLGSRAEVRTLSYCTDRSIGEAQQLNIVNVALAPGHDPDLGSLERQVATTSACGVCGTTSIEGLAVRAEPPAPGPLLDPELLVRLPERMRPAQRVFATTGGVHAAALFTAEGELVVLREDVGRHNAVDKVVGWALLADRLPLAGHVLAVSGRTSYEILQKAVPAGIGVVGSVSAPSSLAVRLATDFGVTLYGFCRDGRANLYAGAHRLG